MRELHRALCDTPNGGKFSAMHLSHDQNKPNRDQDRVGTINLDSIMALVLKTWKWLGLSLQSLLILITNMSLKHLEQVCVTPTITFSDVGHATVQCHLIRSNGGATTRYYGSNWRSEQSVRRGISEIRRVRAIEFDDLHSLRDQIANGHRYGDGTDLNGYQVLQTVETQVAGAELLPENRRGRVTAFCRPIR